LVSFEILCIFFYAFKNPILRRVRLPGSSSVLNENQYRQSGFVYEAEQKEYRTEFVYEYRTREELKKKDTEILRTDRIPQKEGITKKNPRDRI
jgi:hypothetical protein